MGHALTNRTQQTPLGFGPLGFTLEPGESRTVTAAEFAQVEAHPVIAGWVAEGKVLVAEKAPETAPAPAEPEPMESEAPPLPKVPTPTAKK